MATTPREYSTDEAVAIIVSAYNLDEGAAVVRRRPT